jgi:energy-coupling factor transporter transmembrane protein EcfT
MMGTIRINFIVGTVAFILTFALSIGSNIWVTTLLRSLYSFVIIFLIVFLCRYVLGTVAGLNRMPATNEQQPDEQHKGTAFDAVTPDEDEVLRQMLKGSEEPKTAEQEDVVFAPLNPPKLSTKGNLEAEQLAQALRRMSEE